MTAEQQKEENKSMTVGQKIKYFRKRKGYTQKEVGALLGFSGISAGTRMAQYETGVRVPKSKTLESLAKLFGVSSTALSTPDLNTPEGLMHTFFEMEDMYGLSVSDSNGQICFVISSSESESADILLQILSEWVLQKMKLEIGAITKDEYDEWRYNYPGKV